ncbi:MAG: prepilin peptidase, partial [Lachnospiraceae bacterium]|nr:prepilin peptidase [Lachnospiraceae bacterium]
MKLLLCLTLLSVAAATDIQSFRVSNRLIASGLLLGIFSQILEYGMRGIGVFLLNVSIPVILLYLL